MTLKTTAPARVNLLGEHTDYTGGLVLPMAIPFFTQATISAATDEAYSFKSERFHNARSMAFDERTGAVREWSDYPVGVLRELQALGIVPPAFVLEITGNVPLGSGLSSSASVEVATAYAILAMSGQTMPLEEVATLCRRAENNYVGSPCGIMDQFVVTAAKAGHALLLDTGSLEYENIPMNHAGLESIRVVICNSMVKHSIASGEYGVRHRQVMEGQSALLAKYPQLQDLGDASLEQLEEAKGEMSAEAYLRCRHILSENARVREAREIMLAGDPVRLGKLMLVAHASQRDDFQCSCDEIDFLVDAAAALPGCFGARLTGGGFGGCTVNLVEAAHAEEFAVALKRAYKQRFDVDAETYICEAVDGAAIRSEQAVAA